MKARPITLYFTYEINQKKGAITTTTAVVCVYFESTENTPDMGIKFFFFN